MAARFQQVEKLVYWSVAKPLAWALYGGGVILAFVAVAIFHGGKWLVRRRKGVACAR